MPNPFVRAASLLLGNDPPETDDPDARQLLEQLGLDAGEITFTPHLLPIPRGILSTIYVRFNEKMTQAAVEACYAEFYKSSPMVRLYGSDLPQIQYSVRTNYSDIGVKVPIPPVTTTKRARTRSPDDAVTTGTPSS